jgi:hypothetical protein
MRTTIFTSSLISLYYSLYGEPIMPDSPKITFQLTERPDARLEVRVTAPGGEAVGETALPSAALLDQITPQNAHQIPAALVEEIGAALYGVLVNESVDEVVIDTLNDARRDSRSLQFELRFDADQVGLVRYPWEMIRNPQGQFPVREGQVDLTRYITYPQPPPMFDSSISGLPLLRVVASPPNLAPISAGALTIQPLETLLGATFDQFMRRMLIDRLKLWAIQFDGHGALAARCAACDTLNGPEAQTCWNCSKPLADAKKIGALAFEKGAEAQWIATAEFGSVLYNAQARLALLLACESARVGSQQVFSGLAPGLLLAGVPAVIGMQYPVLDTFANSFANEFYAALLKEDDILSALRLARRLNMLGAWYSPTLYLRRQPAAAEKSTAIYLTRAIDTAAPTKFAAGAAFLARLWIRRPQTKALTVKQLRDELGVDDSVPVRQRKGEAEVKFEPLAGRKLRRGEVDVRLTSTLAEITPPEIKLFVDEQVDAPPAIFTVRGKDIGKAALVFTVWQDGGQIHSMTHSIEFYEAMRSNKDTAEDEIATHSEAVDLAGEFQADATLAGSSSRTGEGLLKRGEPPQDAFETTPVDREEFTAASAPPAPASMPAPRMAAPDLPPQDADATLEHLSRDLLSRQDEEPLSRGLDAEAPTLVGSYAPPPPAAAPVSAPQAARQSEYQMQEQSAKKSGAPLWLWLIGCAGLAAIAICAGIALLFLVPGLLPIGR